jgi:hypothetical protein
MYVHEVDRNKHEGGKVNDEEDFNNLYVCMPGSNDSTGKDMVLDHLG